MSFNQRMETAKPYFIGFVLGLIAAPIIAFGAGWVSTSGARAEAVENARIEALTGVCSHKVGQIVAAQDIDPTTFKGFANRDKRTELVASALADMSVPEALASRIKLSCNRSLA